MEPIPPLPPRDVTPPLPPRDPVSVTSADDHMERLMTLGAVAMLPHKSIRTKKAGKTRTLRRATEVIPELAPDLESLARNTVFVKPTQAASSYTASSSADVRAAYSYRFQGLPAVHTVSLLRDTPFFTPPKISGFFLQPGIAESSLSPSSSP